jgi:hypothetical protein
VLPILQAQQVVPEPPVQQVVLAQQAVPGPLVQQVLQVVLARLVLRAEQVLQVRQWQQELTLFLLASQQ